MVTLWPPCCEIRCCLGNISVGLVDVILVKCKCGVALVLLGCEVSVVLVLLVLDVAFEVSDHLNDKIDTTLELKL